MHHSELPMHALVDFVKARVEENAASFGRMQHWVSEIYYVDLLSEGKKVACSLKFRIRGQVCAAPIDTCRLCDCCLITSFEQDAYAPGHGRSIALDGIEVYPEFQRMGMASGILRDMACSLAGEPWKIAGVVLNPVSDAMEALLDKMGVEFRSRGVACIGAY